METTTDIVPRNISFSNGSIQDFNALRLDMLQTAKDISELVGVNTKFEIILTDVSSIFKNLGQIPSIITDASVVLKLVNGLMTFLNSVPFVNVIVAAFQTFLTNLDQFLTTCADKFASFLNKIAEPCRKVVDSLLLVLGKVNRVLTKFAEDIPTFVNGLHIANCLVELLNPLVNMFSPSLKDIAIFQKIKDFVDKLADIKNGALEKIKPILAWIRDLGNFLKPIIDPIKRFGDEALQQIQGVVQFFANLMNTCLSPIQNAFNKVKEACSPVAWLFDAARWLLDNILRFIVNGILRLTGLDKLIERAIGWVLNKLGLDSLISVMSSLNDNTSKSDDNMKDEQILEKEQQWTQIKTVLTTLTSFQI